jgi:hypothetical protein
MISDVTTSFDQPQDRLTRICDDMTKVFDHHPEHIDGDKCMVFLDDGHRGGIVLHGYDDQVEAMTDLLMHMKAMFKSAGKNFDIVFLDPEGVDRA